MKTNAVKSSAPSAGGIRKTTMINKGIGPMKVNVHVAINHQIL
jgi:hypothetical protein